MIELSRGVKDQPFKERAGSPDVGVPNTAPGWLCDVLLLKELLQRLGHHRHCIHDVGRLVLTVNELETQKTWCTHTHAHAHKHTNTHTHTNTCTQAHTPTHTHTHTHTHTKRPHAYQREIYEENRECILACNKRTHMHVDAPTCTHAHVCTHTQTNTHTHTHPYTNIQSHVRTHIHTHRFQHTHTHTYAHARMHARSHTHTNTKTDTHTHTVQAVECLCSLGDMQGTELWKNTTVHLPRWTRTGTSWSSLSYTLTQHLSTPISPAPRLMSEEH